MAIILEPPGIKPVIPVTNLLESVAPERVHGLAWTMPFFGSAVDPFRGKVASMVGGLGFRPTMFGWSPNFTANDAQYVNLGNIPGSTYVGHLYTVIALVRAKVGVESTLVAKYSDVGEARNWNLVIRTNGTVGVGIGGGGGASGAYALTDGEWYLIAWGKLNAASDSDSGRIRIFDLHGRLLETSIHHTFSASDTTAPVTIGGHIREFGAYGGDIPLVMSYNKYLTDAELSNIARDPFAMFRRRKPVVGGVKLVDSTVGWHPGTVIQDLGDAPSNVFGNGRRYYSIGRADRAGVLKGVEIYAGWVGPEGHSVRVAVYKGGNSATNINGATLIEDLGTFAPPAGMAWQRIESKIFPRIAEGDQLIIGVKSSGGTGAYNIHVPYLMSDPGTGVVGAITYASDESTSETDPWDNTVNNADDVQTRYGAARVVYAPENFPTRASILGDAVNIAWGGNANPGAQNIHVPVGCSQMVAVWARYGGSTFTTPPTWQLGGVAPQRSGMYASSGDDTRIGYAVWDNPTPGASVALDPNFITGSSNESTSTTVCSVFAVQGAAPVSGWLINGLGSGPAENSARTFTLTGIKPGYLAVHYGTQDGVWLGNPAVPAGWETVAAQTLTATATRLSKTTTTGTSQVFTAQAPLFWSTLLGFVIPDKPDSTRVVEPATVAWPSTSNPSAVDVYVHPNASQFVMLWRRYTEQVPAFTPTATLGGVKPTRISGATSEGDTVKTGVLIWDNPPTGVVSLDPDFGMANIPEGSADTLCTVFSVVDAIEARYWTFDQVDANPANEGAARSVTLDAVIPGSLLVQYDTNNSSTSPGIPEGWETEITQVRAGRSRLSSKVSEGGEEIFSAQNVAFSSLVGIAIPPAIFAPDELGPFLDTFAGKSGTPLSGRLSDSLHYWEHHPNWGGGEILVRDGAAILEVNAVGSPGALMLAEGEPTGEYDIEVEMTVGPDIAVRTDSHGIVWRYSSAEDDGYLLRYNGSSWGLFRVDNGEAASLNAVLSSDTGPVSIRIEVRAAGDTIFINDVEVLSHTDTSYPTGRVGFRVFGVDAVYDSIAITPFTPGGGEDEAIGTGAALLPALTAIGTGVLLVAGSGTSIFPLLTAAGGGVAAIAGGGESILPLFVAEGAAQSIATAVGTLTLPAMTALGAGGVFSEGDGVATLPALTVVGVGVATVRGVGQIVLPLFTVDAGGAGAIGIEGAGVATLPELTASGVGELLIFGSGSATLPLLVAAGFAGINPAYGAGATPLPPLTALGTGVVLIAAGGSATIPALLATSFGAVAITGEGAAVIPLFLAFGGDVGSRAGSGEATLPALTLSGVGYALAAGVGAAQIPMFTAIAAGFAPARGLGSAQLPALMGAGSAISAIEGSGRAILPLLTIVGEGDIFARGEGVAVLPLLVAQGFQTRYLFLTYDTVTLEPLFIVDSLTLLPDLTFEDLDILPNT